MVFATLVLDSERFIKYYKTCVLFFHSRRTCTLYTHYPENADYLPNGYICLDSQWFFKKITKNDVIPVTQSNIN